MQRTREQTSSSPETSGSGSATIIATTSATTASIPQSSPYAPPHTHIRTNSSHSLHRQATAPVPAPPSPSTKHTLLDSFEEITAPQSPAADERVNPMEVTYFSWGIKAIMKAFAHACRTDSRMESHEAIERSQILSMIWRFVSACLGQQDDKSELTALEIRTNAIEELQQLVHRGVIEAIFSILAFTYLDVCQGPFGVWHRHLQGARSLLDVHCANRDQLYAAFAATPGLQQAVTLLCWYDLMGSLALGDRPLIFENWHREAIEDSFFTLVNCPRDVLLLFQDLQNAAAATRSPPARHSVSSDSPVLSASSATSPPPPPFSGTVPDGVLLEAIRSASTMQVDTTSAVVAANNLWRLVPLLLAVTRRFGPASDATAQSIVSKVFALLERIPSETGISQHLAAVLFIISRHTRAESQRDLVRRYYRFWASEPFPLYPDALGRVEAMWAQS